MPPSQYHTDLNSLVCGGCPYLDNSSGKGNMTLCPILCCAPVAIVIPASEPESWAALCVVLRCVVVIPPNASQGPVSEHGVTAVFAPFVLFRGTAAFATACAYLLDSGSSPE